MEAKKRAPKAVVVGGSIAGLSCAHALIDAGWEVTVIEKSISPPDATGAGLSLEPRAREIIGRWLSNPGILDDVSLPLHQVIVTEKKTRRVLVSDEKLVFRCVHWTDLHSTLHRALPPNIILWGHRFLSLCISDDKASISIKARVLQTNEIVEIVGDLLIAADGCQSMIRRHFLPNHKLRYSGYSAWRGVFNYSDDETSSTMVGIRRAYPVLRNGLYIDLAGNTHCLLFELRNKRLNWLWYFNMPEPNTEGSSLTIKVSNDMINEMHEEADKVWSPELAQLIKETKEPFINVIYDCDPLAQYFWDNVVLVGDAAHPTTPHAAKGTNMTIIDAEVLGLCLKKWGVENLSMALQEFQSIRHPEVSEIVLHSRKLGCLRQGLPLHDNKSSDPKAANREESGA